tara:strand:- start:20478 stop:20756 length:279 start_codon:yes stop_codon:yes gene_type:complete
MKFIQRARSTFTLERIVSLIIFIYPLTAIPQLYNIYIKKEVTGVSILMWIGFLAVTIPLLLHVIKNKDKKLTIMYSLWVAIYLIVILGLIIN